MKKLVVRPNDWPCKLGECRPGLFMYDACLGLKSEYGEFFVVASGEAFWGGVTTEQERAVLVVQPCHYEWSDE